MKYTPSTLFLFFILVSLFFACEKEEKTIVIFECEQPYTLDSIRTLEALVGSWSWSAAICVNRSGEVVNTDRYSNLGIKFTSNNTLILIDYDAILQESPFTLRRIFGDRYTIETTPSIEQISGLISFCDDSVSFNDGYRDLCTNTFTKTN